MSSINEDPSCSTEDDAKSCQNEVPQLEASGTSHTTDSAENLLKANVKKAAAHLIGEYYSQLMRGCGNNTCCNPDCSSSGKVGSLTNDQAAARALKLLKNKAQLCNTLVKTNLKQAVGTASIDGGRDSSRSLSTSHPCTCKASLSSIGKNVKPIIDRSIGLTEERTKSTIADCKINKNYARLRILLRTIFSNDNALKCSFLKSELSTQQSTDCVKLNSGHKMCNKEQLRAAEMDLDKDVDSQEDKYLMDVDTQSCSIMAVQMDACKNSPQEECVQLDLESLKRFYELLYNVPESEFNSTLMDAIRQLLKDSLTIQLKVFSNNFKSDPLISNIFIILLENPTINSSDFTEEVLGELCKVMSQLGIEQQATLTRHISKWEASRIHKLLQSLHQVITIQILTNEFTRDFTINDEDTITSATRVMKIIYFASILQGQLDYPLLNDLLINSGSSIDATSSTGSTGILNRSNPVAKSPPWDSLGKTLKIHPLDAKKPAIPFEEFYDDFLSDQLEMDRDFAYYKAGATENFSFLSYPFILTPATKALGLYYDNRIRMYSERRMSLFQTVMAGAPGNPYLNLRIRRDHIIEDALVELELIALENPGDLKKQLVVEFEGEQGIDEGGVSKEFFQLIIEQIFNQDYAMFCLNPETQNFWFNPTSYESDAQFTLVGVILGLAIYNNIILDLHFPAVMYKKICGKRGSFHDLQDWNKTIYHSLNDMLEYEGDDMADMFLQTFRIGYHDVFGTSLHHDLKPDADNILVNQQNKQEFVDLYANFLLNNSVEVQFTAFRKGFSMVTDDSPLQHFFRPHELELLVCGSQQYDFVELRKSTEYDGGFSTESPIIGWFWGLVDEMTTDEKKQLLQFTTGSARVPVGGLARLKLVIARHGPDSNRLPTAHTCFNVLLLPDYVTKEKLKDRLLKAIKYSQGFGML